MTDENRTFRETIRCLELTEYCREMNASEQATFEKDTKATFLYQNVALHLALQDLKSEICRALPKWLQKILRVGGAAI